MPSPWILRAARRLVPWLWLSLALTASAAGYQELAASIRAGDSAKVAKLLQTGVSSSATEKSGDPAPLLIAASRGKYAIAELLLANGAAPDPRHAPYYNATALMLAVNNHDAAISRLLLDHGADIDLVDSNGDPALNWAVYYGDIALVDLLLQRHANANLVGHGNALEVAMRRGYQPLVERLADYTGKRRTVPVADAKLLAAIVADSAEATKAALAQGAKTDTLDSTNRPALALAGRLGKVAAATALLDAGAMVDTPDPIGFTPLMEAAREGQIAMAQLLLARGAKINQHAAPHGLAMTPLHLAAAAGQLEMIRLLVAQGADLEAPDSEKATPLAWTGDQAAAAKLLLELGAKPLPPSQ